MRGFLHRILLAEGASPPFHPASNLDIGRIAKIYALEGHGQWTMDNGQLTMDNGQLTIDY